MENQEYPFLELEKHFEFYGFQFSYFVRLQISPALYLPKWIVFGIIPLSGIIFMIHGVTFLVDEIKGKDRDH